MTRVTFTDTPPVTYLRKSQKTVKVIYKPERKKLKYLYKPVKEKLNTHMALKYTKILYNNVTR